MEVFRWWKIELCLWIGEVWGGWALDFWRAEAVVKRIRLLWWALLASMSLLLVRGGSDLRRNRVRVSGRRCVLVCSFSFPNSPSWEMQEIEHPMSLWTCWSRWSLWSLLGCLTFPFARVISAWPNSRYTITTAASAIEVAFVKALRSSSVGVCIVLSLSRLFTLQGLCAFYVLGLFS